MVPFLQDRNFRFSRFIRHLSSALRSILAVTGIATLGFLSSCDLAKLDCLDGDISCNDALLGALFAPQKIIAIAGSAGVIWVSRDGGLTYQQITPGDAGTSYSHIKVVSATRILAGGSNGTGPYIIESRSLEANWQAAFNTTGASLQGLEIMDSGDYVACGSSSPQAEVYFNGPDGIWAISQPTVASPGSCYSYQGNFYATVVGAPFNYKRETDGSFSPSGSNTPNPTIDGAASDGQILVLVDNNAGNRVLRSTDGANWTPHAITGASLCSDAAFGNGVFAVFCVGSDQFMLSTDGINWAASATAPSLALSSVQNISFADGFFYVMGQDGGGNGTVLQTLDFGSFSTVFSFPTSTATARDELIVPASLIPSN